MMILLALALPNLRTVKFELKKLKIILGGF